MADVYALKIARKSLNKIEFNKIVQMRAEQLANGAATVLTLTERDLGMDWGQLAQREILDMNLPISFPRTLPDGTAVTVCSSNLEKDPRLRMYF